MSRKEQVERVMSMLAETERVRNISVIAHVDHGKSTLTNTLVSRAGLMKANNTDLFTDFDEDEKEKGITIKSTAVSMEFLHPTPVKPAPEDLPQWTKEDAEKAQRDKEQGVERPPPPERKTELLPYLINLIDSPGHVDFSSEVSAALRVTDGALVVVDCVEGVRVQTKTVLRQALMERIKPVLFLNKLDRVFLELNKDPEEIYQTLRKTIESVNVIIATYQDAKVGDWSVYPQAGTVAFGSGLQGWAFGLRDFARVLHNKFNISEKKMMKKLWGDNFWDPKKQSWSTTPLSDDGRKLQRGFTVFVMQQLRTLFHAVENKDVDLYSKFMSKFGAKYDAAMEELPRRKDVAKQVLQGSLPAATALVDLIVTHLPSPAAAQKYRVEVLYSGPMDDACAQAIRDCDPKGPVMMYVSKMVPTNDFNHFYAFGRVFSGTLRTGDTVRIIEGGTGERNDVAVRKLPGMVLMMGPYVHSMGSCPPGALVGLVGIDALLTKTGTITTDAKAYEFVTMKHSVSPVVRRSVEVVNPAHLNKLTLGLKRLSKADSMVQIYLSPTGEHILAGCGELHLEMCVSDLRKKYLKDVEIKIADPVVSYCETVDAASDQVCLAKSPNKLNRVFMTAEPLGPELCDAIDADRVPIMKGQEKARVRLLAEEFKWDLNDAKKVWGFGLPPDSRANVLVDKSRAVQYLNEVKDTLMTAFTQTTLQGVYAHEPLRGVRFNVEDAKIHHDPAHRGAGQIIPSASNAMCAAQMSAKPRLLEPIYMCEVTVGREAASGVYDTLRTRRAVIVDEVADERGGMVTVRAHLPVAESFGFPAALRKNTSGQAFPELVFSHWGLVPGLITDVGSPAHRTVMAIRQRKGLKPELPVFTDYNDKL